jgi:hypothetical protein
MRADHEQTKENYMTDTAITSPESLIGKFVIARCTGAGVHAGTLVSLDGADGATLSGSRRLHRWWAGQSAFLSGVATFGLHTDAKKKPSMVGAPIDVSLLGVCELIVCTDAAATSITEYATHVAN